MNSSRRIVRVLADRPLAEVGEPALATADDRRGLLAVAGATEGGKPAPIAVYDTSGSSSGPSCVALAHSRFPVRALAFHPELPLLAIGTGAYDGGYHFEGELLLLDLTTGAAVSLFEHWLGREVRGLEWADGTSLHLLLAPPDDWKDRTAHREGHRARLHRANWRGLAAGSVSERELTGPRVPALRSDGSASARALLDGLATGRERRGPVHAVAELADGRLLAPLPGVLLECRTPTGEPAWAVPTNGAGHELVIAPDEDRAWVYLTGPHSDALDAPATVAEVRLADGAVTARHQLPVPAFLFTGPDDLPGLAPRTFRPLRIRRGTLAYSLANRNSSLWVTAADPTALPAEQRAGRLAGRARTRFRQSWEPGQRHFGGPGVELPDGDLLHAGTVYDGRGLQPGGSFVVRRDPSDGAPRWAFRTDLPATALDLDMDRDTVHLAYEEGEVVSLSATDGTVRHRAPLTLGPVVVRPTALTVPGPGRLLVGTVDGRVLDCVT
ncbi:hypothetical protein [Kitasatospora sp. NPDC004272]